MYGSAEVIGLVMAKLMNLPQESYATAQCLGRAFQYINFIRDLAEDTALGRQYIPIECCADHAITHLSASHIAGKEHNFRQLIQAELNRYRAWQTEGERGFAYIPRRFRIPIKTAADLYRSTAKKIESDPFVILDHAVKPSLARILGTLSKNLLVA
jgi:phytoene synthase